MRKHFLLLFLMALLPLAGWSVERITVTLGTINKVYGEPDPAVTELDFSWTKDGGGTTTEVTAANLLHALDYRRVSAGDEVNSVKYYTMVANSNKPDDWVLVIANQGVVNIMPKSLGTGTDAPNTGITIANISELSYTNELKTPDLTVNYTIGSFNENLEKDRDYTVVFANNKDAGTATATLTGIGNYEGSVVKKFTIAPRSLANVTIADIPDQTFAWDNNNVAIAQTPGITVTDAELGTTLVAGTDYVMQTADGYTDGYKDNYNAGTAASVQIVGLGNYDNTTTATQTFTINPMSIVDAEGNLINGFGLGSTTAAVGLVYTGKALTPGVAFRCHGTNSNVNANRTVTYANNINATTAESKATITWTGINNLTGSYTFKFDIAQRPVADLTFNASLEADETYTGSQITKITTGMVTYGALPALVAGTDFDVVDGENKNIGDDAGSTAFSFKGNYTGDVTKYFDITAATLTVKAKNFTKSLGNADPTSDELAEGKYYEITGFVGEEATTVTVTGAPTFAIAGHTETAGTKTGVISISSVAGLSAPNYSFAIGATADLIISKASVTITATDTEKTYGYVLPTLNKDAFAFTATGLNGAEEITALTFTVKDAENNTYVAGQKLNVGTYYITPSDAAATSPSYVFDYAPAATLTINPYKLKIEAQTQAIDYGATPTLDDFTDTYVKFYDLNVPSVSDSPADLAGLGVTRDAFIDELTWSMASVDPKPYGDAGQIEVSLVDDPQNPVSQLFTNFEVTTQSANVTYNSTPATLTLTRVSKANLGTATVAADIAQYDKVENVNVTIKFADTDGLNTLKPNKWYAFILPFETDAKTISNAFGYGIVDLLNTGNTDTHKTVFSLKMNTEKIPANTPFIVKVWDTFDMTVGVTFNGVKIVAPEAYDEIAVRDAAGNQFIGSYTGINGLGDYKPGYSGHVLWWSLQKDDQYDNNALKAKDNAYLRQMSAFSYVPGDVAAHEFIIEEFGGGTTVIKGINFENAQEINTEGLYNMNGMKLNSVPTQKGVYIQNGKKVVIK